jgi:hypothetical protein
MLSAGLLYCGEHSIRGGGGSRYKGKENLVGAVAVVAVIVVVLG